MEQANGWYNRHCIMYKLAIYGLGEFWFQLSIKFILLHTTQSILCVCLLFLLFSSMFVPAIKVKFQQSLPRPAEAPRVPGGWGSHISKQSVHEGASGVSPMHQPPLPQGNSLVLISVRGWDDPRDIVCLEGLFQWKIPVIPSRIKPMTFQLVASCLNHLRHCLPPFQQ